MITAVVVVLCSLRLPFLNDLYFVYRARLPPSGDLPKSYLLPCKVFFAKSLDQGRYPCPFGSPVSPAHSLSLHVPHSQGSEIGLGMILFQPVSVILGYPRGCANLHTLELSICCMARTSTRSTSRLLFWCEPLHSRHDYGCRGSFVQSQTSFSK